MGLSSGNGIHLFIISLLLGLCCYVDAQYEDVRCKCVCPRASSVNVTEGKKGSNIQVYINSTNEPSECKCENIVPKSAQEEMLNFCDRCQCEWQRRNTKTIQVVIVIIICIISLLFLYMLFLLCLDPLMSRRPKTYQEHQNEEDTQSIHREISSENLRSRRPNTDFVSRVEHEVSRVRGAQEKWKGTVSEQRRNIYDKHSMLN